MTVLKRWLPSIIVMLVIFAVSSVPGKSLNAAGLGPESYHINGHFLLFLVLGFTFFKATKSIPLSILFTFIYGSLDEFHQLYTPGRSCSTFDVFVDTIGGIISGIIIWKSNLILPKILRTWLKN